MYMVPKTICPFLVAFVHGILNCTCTNACQGPARNLVFQDLNHVNWSLEMTVYSMYTCSTS